MFYLLNFSNFDSCNMFQKVETGAPFITLSLSQIANLLIMGILMSMIFNKTFGEKSQRIHTTLGIIHIIFCMLFDSLYDGMNFPRTTLLVIAMGFMCLRTENNQKIYRDLEIQTDKENQPEEIKIDCISQIPSSINSPALHRRRSLSQILNDDEKWLDLLDQGYFLCNKNRELIYSNKKAYKFMNSMKAPFRIFTECLVKTNNKKQNLAHFIEEILQNTIDGCSMKCEFEIDKNFEEKNYNFNESNDIEKASIYIELFNYCYTARVWKLNSEYILIIMKEKNQSATVVLAEKLGRAANSTLSHELKTQLNSIVGNLDLLEDGVDEDHITYFKLSLSSAHILSCRLSDLLDYMQIQEEKFKLHKTQFSIKELFKEIKSHCSCLAKQKGLRFYVNISTDIPDRINGDRLRIKQILVNLLSKTIEYTDFGMILLKTGIKNNCLLQFKVKSKGIGTHYEFLRQAKSGFPHIP